MVRKVRAALSRRAEWNNKVRLTGFVFLGCVFLMQIVVKHVTYTVIQDKSANECVENEPLENRVQNEQPSVCTAGKFLALTLLACAWTVLCVVVAPVGWHLAPLSLRPKGTRISGAAPSAQI